MTPKRTVYLDNAATTKLDPRVLEAMVPALAGSYGNASSLHAAGRTARKLVEGARAELARAFACEPGEVLFTGCGSEADNLAVLGAARAAAGRGRHVVTTAIEHSAVLQACARLKQEGFQVTRVPPDLSGHVSPAAIREAMTPTTVLVSVMAVNNEVGTLQPLGGIGQVVAERSALFHVDAVQAAGKVPLRPAEWGAHLVALSAHKLHGPKGVGALYVRRGTPLIPLAFGGEHEFGLRPGTENVAGIVGFAEAMRIAEAEREAAVTRVRTLRDRLEAGIRARVPDAVFNGGEPRVPHVLNVSFPGAEGEAILLGLDGRGVCVSTGSACSAHSAQPSHVLLAMRRSHALAQGSIRFSLGRETSEEEIDYALDAVVETVDRLRRMSPLYEG